TKQERYGSVFKVQGANTFNSFIYLAILIDLPLDGYAYTWAHKTTNKMSKLDRFLVSKGLLASFQYLLAFCLDRNLLDNRPILIQKLSIDYGPTPFRFFRSWFNLDGFDKLVKDTWKSLAIVDSNGMINLKKKLQALKIVIKQWTKDAKKSGSKIYSSLSYKGDENTKFFQGIINSKRSQLAICGILVDGEWIVDPLAVKNLEQNVSNEEINSAVWDYGTNKSPGPDGFTFEFFRRYWKLLEHDILAAVKEFFALGTFPLGCNSSFIALIPKIHDAKVVKDYRPISLIGSLYKIIAKSLANILSFVISDLTEFQSAFVSNRQILDGLFILNELLSWCKHTKFKAMQWLVRDDDDDFDVEIVYDIYKFVPDEVQTIDGIAKELGYSPTEVRYYHYLKTKTNLDYGLVTLGSDQDVNELLKYVVRNKVIDLYSEHDSTTINTYFNGPSDGVLTADNMPPSPSKSQGIEYYGEIDASVSSKGKEPDVEASGNEAEYFDPFKDLDAILGQYAKLLMITNDLEDKIDSERRKMLRELRKKEMFDFVVGQRFDNIKLVNDKIINHSLESMRKLEITKNDNERGQGHSVNGKRKRTYDVSKNKQGGIKSQPSVTQSQGPSEVGITQSQTTSLGIGSSQVASPSAMSPQCAGSSQGDRLNQGVGSNEGA
nr:RNA-directed DNA polymerase, eukaryota [Tanacetum cinerariifolium]